MLSLQPYPGAWLTCTGRTGADGLSSHRLSDRLSRRAPARPEATRRPPLRAVAMDAVQGRSRMCIAT